MNKELRLKIYDKYGAHCAYCGNIILLEEMQIDHIFPKHLKYWLTSNKMKKYIGVELKDTNDEINLNPSCRRCNHYKRGLKLEEFRKQIKTLHKRIKKIYINKVAIDYGILKIKEFDGLFYFEKLNKKKHNEKTNTQS